MTKARQLADLGNAYDDGALSNRNIIINGAMKVAQRGTSFTSPISSTFTLDRWKYEENTDNVVNVEQSSDAPAGFERSIKVTTTTAAGSVGSGDFAQLIYKTEGHDISRLAYGTSDAKTSTISFWVKSSVIGSFPFSLQNHDGTRVFPVTYTVNSANTWEYKTITIAGDTGGTWTTNNNTTGIRFTFLWISGSNFTGGVDGGGWAATTGFANLTSSYTANLDVVNANFQITGVQLELGDTATPFEHKNVGQELLACQRYYQQVDRGSGIAPFSTAAYISLPYITTMRAIPTFGTTGALAVNDARVNTIQSTAHVTAYNPNISGSFIQLNNFSGLVQNSAVLMRGHAGTFVTLDAEL